MKRLNTNILGTPDEEAGPQIVCPIPLLLAQGGVGLFL